MTSACSFVSDPSGLCGILESGAQIVVAPRKLEAPLAISEEMLASIGPLEIHADLAGPTGSVERDRRGRVGAFLPQLDGMPFAAALRRDVVALGERFAAIATLDSVHVSVEIFDHDACRKWHTDRVRLRMLVTYAGPGTEWALPEGVDRGWLGQTSLDLDAVNDRIVFDRAAVRRAGAGDVLLCKGDLFEGELEQGLVHRSPAVHRDARWRLLVRIDEPGRCA